MERKPYDFASEAAAREDDHDISDVGRDAKMPWQMDGRRWHTIDRVGRTGNPCRWDGRILAEVVDRIEGKSELFGETDWSERTVVEIRAAKKSDGWFFHAITAEEWLLKMKFRTTRNTFRREELIEKLDLKPLNDMPDLPLYGTEPRVGAGIFAGRGRRSSCAYTATTRSTARSSGTSSIGRWRVSARSPRRCKRNRTSCTRGGNSAARGISGAAGVSGGQASPLGTELVGEAARSARRDRAAGRVHLE